MAQDFVRLSHLWQRRGFMNMTDWFRTALFAGLNFHPLPDELPTGAVRLPENDALDRYIANCTRWRQEAGEGTIPDANEHAAIIEKARRFSIGERGYRPTVSEIEVELKSRYPLDTMFPSVRLVSGDHERLWRWPWEQFAFGAFWALFFHVENEFLRRPRLILDELMSLRDRWRGYRGFDPDDPEGEWLWFALYERLLGILADEVQRKPHYVSNIVERVEYKPAEQRERVVLFHNATLDLMDHVRAALNP
ncbi:MAG: hypothetical protein HY340_00700 [Candidatus Kerfeldbacteria bacterium]|nr:hypothetical protein [Candidatus Kerfeldbacteria bacterium]